MASLTTLSAPRRHRGIVSGRNHCIGLICGGMREHVQHTNQITNTASKTMFLHAFQNRTGLTSGFTAQHQRLPRTPQHHCKTRRFRKSRHQQTYGFRTHMAHHITADEAAPPERCRTPNYAEDSNQSAQPARPHTEQRHCPPSSIRYLPESDEFQYEDDDAISPTSLGSHASPNAPKPARPAQ